MIQSKITDFFYKKISTNKYNIKKNDYQLLKYNTVTNNTVTNNTVTNNTITNNTVTNNKKMQNLVFGLSDKISKLQIEIYNNYNNNNIH